MGQGRVWVTWPISTRQISRQAGWQRLGPNQPDRLPPTSRSETEAIWVTRVGFSETVRIHSAAQLPQSISSTPPASGNQAMSKHETKPRPRAGPKVLRVELHSRDDQIAYRFGPNPRRTDSSPDGWPERPSHDRQSAQPVRGLRHRNAWSNPSQLLLIIH